MRKFPEKKRKSSDGMKSTLPYVAPDLPVAASSCQKKIAGPMNLMLPPPPEANAGIIFSTLISFQDFGSDLDARFECRTTQHCYRGIKIYFAGTKTWA